MNKLLLMVGMLLSVNVFAGNIDLNKIDHDRPYEFKTLSYVKTLANVCQVTVLKYTDNAEKEIVKNSCSHDTWGVYGQMDNPKFFAKWVKLQNKILDDIENL